MNLQKIFGETIRKKRLEKKISQVTLSFESDIDRTYISGIEKGERNISIQVAYKLASALQISFSDLIKEIENHGEYHKLHKS
ncbi:MAG: helix-turn-helix transcriptional regulator [Bacteroidales bacterium]|nr:helix-turn-helix transcriptional regulator [Bacteroidales bacterium]